MRSIALAIIIGFSLPLLAAREHRELPRCSLRKTPTHYIVMVGKEEVTRIKHSNGTHMVSLDSSHDVALFTALKAISSLRENGACR